jgi:hypothetical protein
MTTLTFQPLQSRSCVYRWHACLYVTFFLPRGLEETVGYVWAHNLSPSPPRRTILSGACADSCAVHGCCRHTVPLLRNIRDAARADLTSRTVVVCAMKTRRNEQKACVCNNENLMRREGSD